MNSDSAASDYGEKKKKKKHKDKKEKKTKKKKKDDEDSTHEETTKVELYFTVQSYFSLCKNDLFKIRAFHSPLTVTVSYREHLLLL